MLRMAASGAMRRPFTPEAIPTVAESLQREVENTPWPIWVYAAARSLSSVYAVSTGSIALSLGGR